MHRKYDHLYHFDIFDHIYIYVILESSYFPSFPFGTETGIFLTPMWLVVFLVPKFVRGIIAGKFQESIASEMAIEMEEHYDHPMIYIYIYICSYIQKPYDISSYHWINWGFSKSFY